MADYELAKEVETIAQGLVGSFHSHLKEAKISYVFQDKAWTQSDGRTILGKAAGRNKLDKLLSERKEDFVIIIGKDRWEKMSDVEKRALVDHELCHCFFGTGRISIYAADGWKPIRRVAVGDLVLTHEGRFKKVLEVFKIPKQEIKSAVTLRFSTTKFGSLSVTENHLFLVNGIWKMAKNIEIGDEIQFLASVCKKCGIVIPYFNKFCSQSHANSFILKNMWKRPGFRKFMSNAVSESNRRRDNSTFIEAGHKKTKELCGKGLHPFGNGTAIRKSMSISGKRKRSWGERKFEWHLVQSFEQEVAPQYPIFKGVMPHNNAKRFYFVDFALPKYKIVIEIDGLHDNRSENDARRQKFIEDLGWQVIRFSDIEVKTNGPACIEKVKRLIQNHEGRYKFTTARVKEVKKWQPKRKETLYNLKVEDDDSYIVRGFVSHNCGISMSSSGETKFTLRGHPIEEFPENLARFEHRRQRIGKLIENPPSAIAIKQEEAPRKVEVGDEEN